MEESLQFYGVIGNKVESWKCCMKESKLDIEIKRVLDNIIRKETNEGEYKKITKAKKYENIYIYRKKQVEKWRKDYLIFFEKTKDNQINPLYIYPYPCKSSQIDEQCDNIKALSIK